MLKKILIWTIVVVGLIGAWVLVVNLQGNRQVIVLLDVDPSIVKIEIYDARDDSTPVATLFPAFDGRRNEVSLKVFTGVEYNRYPRSIFYYFIMFKAEAASKSDTFTFDTHKDRVKLSIGASGHWIITDE